MHTPSPSHSPTDLYVFRSRRQGLADSSFSPCRHPAATPSRRPLVTRQDSSPVLMLTPSPLRRRTNDDDGHDYAMQLDLDDFSGATEFSTPYHPPTKSFATQNGHFKVPAIPPLYKGQPRPPADDDDGLFLRADIGHTSLPLRTPERHPFDTGLLSNSVANSNYSHAPKRKVCVQLTSYALLTLTRF